MNNNSKFFLAHCHQLIVFLFDIRVDNVLLFAVNLVGCFLTCMGRATYYCFFLPWLVICGATIVFDVAALANFLYDLFNTLVSSRRFEQTSAVSCDNLKLCSVTFTGNRNVPEAFTNRKDTVRASGVQRQRVIFMAAVGGDAADCRSLLHFLVHERSVFQLCGHQWTGHFEKCRQISSSAQPGE